MTEQKNSSPDRSRRVYVYWIVSLGMLVVLALLCWRVLLPVLRVRAAVAILAQPVPPSGNPDWAERVPEAFDKLGGREEAVDQLDLYLRLPERVAPHSETAIAALALCGRDGMRKLGDLLEEEGQNHAVILAALGRANKGQEYYGRERFGHWSLFTPRDLIEQSEFILEVKLKPAGEELKLIAEVKRVIKGEFTAKELNIDLSVTKMKDHAKHVAKKVAEHRDGTALFFAGKEDIYSSDELIGLLHLDRRWITLDPAGKAAWEMVQIDDGMQEIWDGGTDTFIRAIDFLIKYPDEELPDEWMVTWEERLRVARGFKGAAEVRALDLDGNGEVSLYVAAASGDRVFKFDPKTGKFLERTKELGLIASTHAAAWADFNADGRPDLASWDGVALDLHLREAGGALKLAGTVVSAPGDECLGLTSLDVGVPGRPGLLWSGAKGPVLLTPKKNAAAIAMTARKLDPGKVDLTALGALGACLVADFDGNGLADIIQLGEKESLLFRCKKPGEFAPAEKCAMLTGRVPWRACPGDWDGDGAFDVFVASRDGCRLWQSRPGPEFEEVLSLSGEICYISRPGGSGAAPCDPNNDGLQDVLVLYGPEGVHGPQVFINRGFRNLGYAGGLDIEDRNLLAEADNGREGQQCGLVADLTGDGHGDMAVVLADGDLYVFPQTTPDPPAPDSGRRVPSPLRVALPARGTAGPVRIVASNDLRSLGAWNLRPGEEISISREEFGEVTIKWRLPGGPEREKKFELDEKTPRFVIPEEKRP